METECGRFSLRLQAPPTTPEKRPPSWDAALDIEAVFRDIEDGPVTPPKRDRKLSKEEFRRKMAEHGIERMSEEERQSGVWRMTFVANRPVGENKDEATADE